jgi:hypothetical protein
MMANPEMSSTQEQGLAAVPPQGRPADAVAALKGDEAVTESAAGAGAGAGAGTGAGAEAGAGVRAESAEEPAAASVPATEASRSRSHQAGARQSAEPRRRPAAPQKSQKSQKQSRTDAPAYDPAYDPEPERMPLMARVLLGDLAVAVVGLVALFVIEVQRFGDAGLSLRRRAWHEDLVVLFVVTGIFAAVTFLLARARHLRVFIVQAIVTALVLTAAITSVATGDPKLSPNDPVPTSTPGHPG